MGIFRQNFGAHVRAVARISFSAAVKKRNPFLAGMDEIRHTPDEILPLAGINPPLVAAGGGGKATPLREERDFTGGRKRKNCPLFFVLFFGLCAFSVAIAGGICYKLG